MVAQESDIYRSEQQSKFPVSKFVPLSELQRLVDVAFTPIAQGKRHSKDLTYASGIVVKDGVTHLTEPRTLAFRTHNLRDSHAPLMVSPTESEIQEDDITIPFVGP